MKPFDICVLTAANDVQAEGYRKQLRWRQRHGKLPKQTEFLVWADPGNHRVGSGGSTLYVLSQLLKRENQDVRQAFAGKRILILHSGGDSRRLPAYSAVGKVFTPLPTAQYDALFDVLLENFQQLPVLEDGQVIIGSGDVVINFHPAFVAFAPTGVTGVAYPEDPRIASGHGVYVVSETSLEQNPRLVDDFLQKPDRTTLETTGALDASQRALVDTGILNLAFDAIQTLLALDDPLAEVVQGRIAFDLYREFTFAFLGKTLFSGGDALAALDFSVSVLPYCGFFHIGKSRELLRNFHSLTYAGALYRFENFTRTNFTSHPALKQAYVFNSHVASEQISLSSPVLIEGCDVTDPFFLQGNNIVTGLPKHSGAITLKKDICLTAIPLKDQRWVGVIYGLDDSFKQEPSPTFLQMPFREWLETMGLNENDLWDDEACQELWTARLFPAHPDAAAALEMALAMQSPGSRAERWNASNRLSLKQILALADHDRILDQRSALDHQAKLDRVQEALLSDANPSLSELLAWCHHDRDRLYLSRKLAALLEQRTDPLFAAHIKKYLSVILPRIEEPALSAEARTLFAEPSSYEDAAFADVRTAIGQGLEPVQALESPHLRIRSDEVVWVSVPARLDFGGGWSDTPPYCLEQGGSVLNAAVKLNGQYPIQVIGKRLAEPCIRINSIDLGQSAVISDLDSLLTYTDPGDWLSLPKAGFVATGILDRDRREGLDGFLQKVGGGIDLTLFSALPAGSGLGTSSLLGAAVIVCLSRMFGGHVSQNAIFQRTLFLEQLMTTGGGWQDQIGGVVGGVKMIQTERGLDQSPRLSWTQLTYPGFELSGRCLLYYTGYRRMAKNILRQIMGRYLERDRALLETISALKTLSLQMKAALDQRDIERFGAYVAEVWECNKRLDRGSTTEDIERLLKNISQDILGAKLLGAGGGGFLFIVSKSTDHLQRIRRILTENPPNDRARFFDFEIDPGGMHVSVL